MVGSGRSETNGRRVTDCRPLVSVVVPMYQGRNWIASTLRSVASQTFTDFEILIVDDGSTDNGHEEAQRVGIEEAVDLRVIRTENSGVAAARNLGIEESRGEFVALLDADDLWHPLKLERQLERLGHNGSPFCTCGYEFMDDRTGRRTAVVVHRGADGVLDRWLALEGNGLALASTALVRRRAIDQLRRFDPTFSVSADLAFALRMAVLGSFDVVPDVLVRYRIHAGQMHRQVSGLASDLERLHDQVFADGLDPAGERRCRANLDAHMGYVHLRKGQIRRGLGYLWSAACRDSRRLVTVPIRAVSRRLRRWLRARLSRPLDGWVS